MNQLKIKKAFTLVELIIVITILVILTTIAFVSFQNYTKDSRDANRLTTINNISKGLDIFQIKTGFYPEPDNKTSFTGAGDKKLHQGIISDNITNIINLSEIPFDPKEKTNYIYSTYSDGKYYQIASEAENITSFLYNTTYAENKSSIVKGNYKFDPSLPSLIVIPNSLTGSSIFDPKVCFVTNGGVNNITSSSGNCLKKEEMSLNTIDNGLVGYWDMESLTTDGKLKDLSGNENHGVFSGGMVYDNSLTGGVLSKALSFSGLDKQRIIVDNFSTGNYTNIMQYGYSMETIILRKDVIGAQGRIAGGFDAPLLRWDSRNINKLGLIQYTGTDYSSADNLDLNFNYFIHIVGIYNGKTQKLYINGILTANTFIDKLKPRGSTKFTIGGYSSGLPEYSFPGIIDELKIYNRVLSEQEIVQKARIAGF